MLIGYQTFAYKKGSKEWKQLGESSTLPTPELYDVLNFSNLFSSLTETVFMLEKDNLFTKESINGVAIDYHSYIHGSDRICRNADIFGRLQ